MAEVQETDLCIVCGKPGPRFYLEKNGRLKYHYVVPDRNRRSDRLRKEGFLGSGGGEPECDLSILPQLRVMFVLKHVLKFPANGEDALEAMRDLGDPSEWFDICNRCTELVDEGVAVVRKLQIYERERKRIVSMLERNHVMSYSGRGLAFGKYSIVRNEEGEFNKARQKLRSKVRKSVNYVSDYIKLEPEDPKQEPQEPKQEPHSDDDWIAGDDNFDETYRCDAPNEGTELKECAESGSVSSAENIKREQSSEDNVEGIMRLPPPPPVVHIVKKDELPKKYVKKKIKRIWSSTRDPDFVCYDVKERPRLKPLTTRRQKQLAHNSKSNEHNVDHDENDDLMNKKKMLKRNQSVRQKITAKIKPKKVPWKRPKKVIKPRIERVAKPKPKPNPGSMSVGTKLMLENAEQHLNMTLITYPPITPDDIAKIPKEGKSPSLLEDGELKSTTSDFQCPSCAKYFSHKYYTIAHIHRVHLGIERPWKCDQCSHTLASSRKMRCHLDAHRNGTLLECQICKRFTCTQRATLDAHIINHQKGKGGIATCHVCDKSFERFRIYITHMVEEHGFIYKPQRQKSFVCEICSLTISGKRQLEFHKIKVHNESDQNGKFPMCSDCSQLFFDGTRLKEHSEKAHGNKFPNYFCEHCGKGFLIASCLRQHLWNWHAGFTKICEVCGVTIPRLKEYRNHRKAVHSETVNMSQDELNEYIQKQKEILPFKCKLCPQAFPFSNLFFKHQRQDHPEVTEKFKCSECGKGFSRQCSVKRHYEVAHLKLELKCDYCGKGFYGKDSLNQHIRNYCIQLKTKKEVQPGNATEGSSNSTVMTSTSLPPQATNSQSFFHPFTSSEAGFSEYSCALNLVQHENRPT